jgi:hypothetical protein
VPSLLELEVASYLLSQLNSAVAKSIFGIKKLKGGSVNLINLRRHFSANELQSGGRETAIVAAFADRLSQQEGRYSHFSGRASLRIM